MYSVAMVVIFVLGYLCIALEHPLKIDKAASALLIGVLTWAVFILFGGNDPHSVGEALNENLA
ncbi:MAG: sodium:proton antiporter, partial [Bacteroidales bacterium]|nr:sodium:proton antiporter [Bacteroidales bacterium]MBR4690501.1 sodium:proton antiporter [Bacteroidales bacterium]